MTHLSLVPQVSTWPALIYCFLCMFSTEGLFYIPCIVRLAMDRFIQDFYDLERLAYTPAKQIMEAAGGGPEIQAIFHTLTQNWVFLDHPDCIRYFLL